jgi:dTDP-4-amino-4,6-dideoxygalactose transaminase
VIPLARPLVGEAEKQAVGRVIDSGGLVQGREVAAFEDEFSTTVEERQCVAVNSGTAALHLSLLALGIGRSDEVVVPSFTFAATANAVALTGATPVFADIDPDNFCIDPDAANAAVSVRTTAIIPVHLYGHPAAMDRLQTLADRHGLALIEDAAQAHAATFEGRPVGALGDVAAFSFYPSKNMTTGEGGMVVTVDADLARRIRLLRNQGMEQAYQNEIVGLNCRMTDLSAAVGRVQLEKLPAWTKARRAVASALDGQLRTVRTPPVDPRVEHVYHQYTVRSSDRDGLRSHLQLRGVGCAAYYPVPVHRLPAFDLQLDLPETERAAGEVLSLPVRPDLTSEEIAGVVDGVESYG